MCSGAAEIRAQKVTEAHKAQLPGDGDNGPSSHGGSRRPAYAKTPAAKYGALARGVFSNPTFWMLSVFSACLNFFIAGFSAFGPKYFEFGFAMTPTLAGIMFGKSVYVTHIVWSVLCVSAVRVTFGH